VFDWAAYLDVADHLVNSVGGEAAGRSAISRAYHACHGTARGDVRSKRVPSTGKGIEHRVVRDWFLEESGQGPIHVRIGTNGHRPKTWRIRADHNRPSFVGVSGFAANAPILARSVPTDLVALP
jgi:hypothetical protein